MSRNTVVVLTVALVVVAGFAVGRALTASNQVPVSQADEDSEDLTVNDTKPPECEKMRIDNLVTGSGNKVDGTAANDLVVGDAGRDGLNGLAGDDCLHGGGDRDSLDGGDGIDICIGGPGTDTFKDCETTHQ